MNMLKNTLLSLLVASATLAPAALAAGRGITGPEMVAILQGEGYKAKLEKDSEGDPIIRTQMSGTSVSVLFYDCKEGRCGSLQFMTGQDLPDGTTMAVVNEFNKNFRYGKAHLDEENDPFLQYDFEVLHANHAQHIVSQVELWEDVLGAYRNAIYGDEDEG